jgi:hypothetical protein
MVILINTYLAINYKSCQHDSYYSHDDHHLNQNYSLYSTNTITKYIIMDLF